VNDYEREKQAMAEMDRALEDTMAKANHPTDQAVAANMELAPYEEFRQLMAGLQSTARQQQLKTEQVIQQTLRQASSALSNAQKTDLIARQIQAMQQALEQQGPLHNPQYFLKMLPQLGSLLQDQQHQADRQITESLQQAVASMNQSQTAMSDSQAYLQLTEMLKQCEKTLQQWQNHSQSALH